MLQIFAQIFESGLIYDDPKTHASHIPVAYIFGLVEDMLGSWSMDAALECSKSVRALDTCCPKDAYVLVDEVVPIILDNWSTIRQIWEDHIHYIGVRNCSVYRVVQELSYTVDADDYVLQGNGLATDVVLSKIQDKASVADAVRRPVRIFDLEDVRNWSGKEVCEVLSRKEFRQACHTILPGVSEEETDLMFDEACQAVTRRSLRACVEEGGWRQLVVVDHNRKVLHCMVYAALLLYVNGFSAMSTGARERDDEEGAVARAVLRRVLPRPQRGGHRHLHRRRAAAEAHHARVTPYHNMPLHTSYGVCLLHSILHIQLCFVGRMRASRA